MALDRAQLLVDACTGQHPPVADEHHPLQPEALAHLVDLVGQGAWVGDVAFVHFDRDRTALGVAQQSVDDLQLPFLAVARVPDASQWTAAPPEIARGDVVEHQSTVVQMAFGQGAFDDDRTKTRLEVLGKPILIDGDPRSDFGLQLSQLAQVLRSHGLKVVTRVVDASADGAAIRREIAANLASKDDFVLVNYARRALGQKRGGHISPLGAYDESSESFLIMDVNPNRAPWVWVRSDELIAAMRTFDTVENRGYLLVSDVE